MSTLRLPTTGGDELFGASGSSTTISMSGGAIGSVVNGSAHRLSPLPARGEAASGDDFGGLFRDEAGLGHQLLFSLSSSSRNFSMSLPVRKIGLSACFSM